MAESPSLDLAVLGVLKEGPMHGYELRKRLSTTLGPLRAVSFGSLYPCLRRLRKEDLVRERDDDQSGRRRRRRTYEITPTGEELFFSQLEQGAVYDAERFRLRFAFFRYLPRESRIGLLERRKVYLQEKLLEFQQSLQSARERIDSYTLTLMNHQQEATELDIKWLEALIDKERKIDSGSSADQDNKRGEAT